MNEKTKYNPHIHHRRSIRLKGYDYAQAGLYFITICCQDRACLFGEIVGTNSIRPNNGNDKQPKMVLNEYGQIAFDEWMKTPEIRPNVELGEFVIMPNHMHGIIRLFGRGELNSPDNLIDNNMGESISPLRPDNSPDNLIDNNRGKTNMDETNMDETNMGETNMGESNMGESISPDKLIDNNRGESISPLRGPSQTIGAIVRGYKSSVTKRLKLMGFDGQLWQRNYYEQIIRNEQSYHTISEYIINNPTKWVDDKFYNP